MSRFQHNSTTESSPVLAAVLVLALTVFVGGIASVRGMVTEAFGGMGRVFDGIDQSYSYDAVQGHGTYTAGSSYRDGRWRRPRREHQEPHCVVVCAARFETRDH